MTLADRAADLIAEFGGSWKFIGVSIALIISGSSSTRSSSFADSIRLRINVESRAGGDRRHAGADHHDVAEPAGRKDRLRADLDYQVNLKNELSLAEVLRRLDVLESERLPKLIDDLKAQTK